MELVNKLSRGIVTILAAAALAIGTAVPASAHTAAATQSSYTMVTYTTTSGFIGWTTIFWRIEFVRHVNGLNQCHTDVNYHVVTAVLNGYSPSNHYANVTHCW